MKLYGYWRSSATWRVRIGLNLKGLAYDYQPVHLVKDGGEQKTDTHRARNPLGQVPVLEVEADGKVVHLSQSLAILQWLDEVYPTPAILPADAIGRARARQLSEVVNAWIQPLQNLDTLARVEALGGDRAVWARAAIADGLGALEATVRDTAGTFLVGDSPTLADICLVPQLYNARRFGVDVTPFPTLLRVEKACEALPAFQAAHPDVQPDATPI
jgi:maleylpyruvate isomerase